MKRALILFTFATILSTGALAAEAPAPAVCGLTDAAAVTLAANPADVGATQAKKAKCPREGIACTDIYDPVICSNGKVYGNACYAYVDCATGCVAY